MMVIVTALGEEDVRNEDNCVAGHQCGSIQGCIHTWVQDKVKDSICFLVFYCHKRESEEY